MPKQLHAYRLSDLTLRQIEDLKRWWNVKNETELIAVAVAMAWTTEQMRHTNEPESDPAKEAQS